MPPPPFAPHHHPQFEDEDDEDEGDVAEVMDTEDEEEEDEDAAERALQGTNVDLQDGEEAGGTVACLLFGRAIGS